MTGLDRPRVTLHFAQSLDGRIALADTRTPLSSHAGLALAYRARAEHDAVLVGRATVKIDNPRLSANGHEGPQPRRVVLASTLDVCPDARIFQGEQQTMVIGVRDRASPEAQARLVAAGAHIRLVGGDAEGLVALAEALGAMRAWGVERLLVEGGARVLSSFLRHHLADEATIEIVPRLLGAPGVAALAEIGVDALDRAVALADARVERADASIVVRGRLAY